MRSNDGRPSGLHELISWRAGRSWKGEGSRETSSVRPAVSRSVAEESLRSSNGRDPVLEH